MTFFKNLFNGLLGGQRGPTAVVEYSAGSYIGSRRGNQDNLRAGRKVPFIKAGERTAVKGVLALADMELFCVCDGVGGGYRGDLAAKFALKAIKRYLKAAKTAERPLREILLDAADAALKEVCAFYETARNLGGCTLVMIALRGDRYAFLNIGDSPAFLIPHDGSILELSQRHNMAWEKMRMGLPAEPSDSNRLLRYLGMEDITAEDIAYITEGTLAEGDWILLCTDGVTNTFSLVSLEDAIRSGLTADQIAEAAAQNEKADNCTALCLRIREIVMRTAPAETEDEANLIPHDTVEGEEEYVTDTSAAGGAGSGDHPM